MKLKEQFNPPVYILKSKEIIARTMKLSEEYGF